MSSESVPAQFMQCRIGCAACCIAPSISSTIPGMPDGKPANTRCVQLSADGLCLLFGSPERPQVCADFQADSWVCGDNREQAIQLLNLLESNTCVVDD